MSNAFLTLFHLLHSIMNFAHKASIFNSLNTIEMQDKLKVFFPYKKQNQI